MKSLPVALVALALLPASALAGPGDPFTDVSSRPVIAQDLQIAAGYWHETECSTVTVLVGPMQAATGENGEVMPASTVWAETTLGSCTIDLSQVAFRSRHGFPRIFCQLIVHEMGHIVGLPDSSSVPMMNETVDYDRAPVCA